MCGSLIRPTTELIGIKESPRTVFRFRLSNHENAKSRTSRKKAHTCTHISAPARTQTKPRAGLHVRFLCLLSQLGILLTHTKECIVTLSPVHHWSVNESASLNLWALYILLSRRDSFAWSRERSQNDACLMSSLFLVAWLFQDQLTGTLLIDFHVLIVFVVGDACSIVLIRSLASLVIRYTSCQLQWLSAALIMNVLSRWAKLIFLQLTE